MKRHRSTNFVGEGTSRAKSSKTASAETGTMAETEQSSENHQEVHISVTLRSAVKAERNDPKPPLTNEERRRVIRERIRMLESSCDSSPSPASGNIANPPGPDPARDTCPSRGSRLPDGQNSAQNGHPAGPAPIENPKQTSLDESRDRANEHDDDSELDNDHSHNSDKNESYSGDEYNSEDRHDIEEEYDSQEDTYDAGYDDGLSWYEELDGHATLRPLADIATISHRAARRAEHEIGSCSAKLIRRGIMRKSFWVEMESAAQETQNLAFELFDRYGRLNPEFYEHQVKKGTGVWGKELDFGDLLLFEEMKVNSSHKRRGIGTKIVNAILEKTRRKVSERVGFFALARPGFLMSEFLHPIHKSVERIEAEKDAERGALSFWQALGFRRVGTSSWLAWTDSPNHPSRQLGIAQDCEGISDADVSLTEEKQHIFRKLADPTVEAAECVDEIQKAFPEDCEDDDWQTIDRRGDTLLHVASKSSKPDLVRFLLSRVPRLAAVRNVEGYTAMEALQKQLERERTLLWGYRSFIKSDAFKGFSDSSVACLAILDNTPGFDLSNLSPLDVELVAAATDEEIDRLSPQLDVSLVQKMMRYRYGCTCGQCIGGFLSPRMRLALTCVANMEHDMALELLYGYDGESWVGLNGDLLTHLPEPVRDKLETNKSIREGFTNMFDHFAKCISKGMVPSEGVVRDYIRSNVSEWPPATRNYLQRGGSVAAVADVIFERAMERDKWAGDGSHQRDYAEDFDKLVVCRNDHEFGFVAGICGYKRVRPVTSRLVDSSGRSSDY